MRKCIFASALVLLAVFASTASAGGVSRSSCPHGLLPLSSNAIGPAASAALHLDPAKNHPQVTAATIATSDTARGQEAKTSCGKTVWQRTVVVYILDRALLPAQSAAERVVFVGKTAAGYQVWRRVH